MLWLEFRRLAAILRSEVMVCILPSSDLLGSERCFIEVCVDDFLGRFAKAAGETIAAKFNFVKSLIASDFRGCKESIDALVVADAIRAPNRSR